MKKTKKKIAFIAALMCLTFAASAQEYFESDGIVYGITSEQTVEVLSNYYLHNTPYIGSRGVWRLRLLGKKPDIHHGG